MPIPAKRDPRGRRPTRPAATAALLAALATGCVNDAPDVVIVVPEPPAAADPAAADPAAADPTAADLATAVDAQATTANPPAPGARDAASPADPPGSAPRAHGAPPTDGPPAARVAAAADAFIVAQPGGGPGGAPRYLVRLDHMPDQGVDTALPQAARHREGDAIGLKLSGVRAGSLGHQLGLRDGDVVHRVAGRRVTSRIEALAVLGALPQPGDFSVDLSRRGAPVTLHYRVE